MSDKAMTAEKISQFLKEAGVFFLSTEDGAQPKCRPLGLHVVVDGTVYFGIGDFKEVYRQMCANPQVEIVACKESRWLRMYGTAVFETTFDLANEVLKDSPLKSIYNDETGNKMMMFHIEQGAAEFRSLMTVEESFAL